MAKTKTEENNESKTLKAVILTGGKQYLVSVGDVLKIEKIIGEFKEGDKVTFDKVLMIAEGENVTVGTPELVGAKVAGTIKEIGRNKKVVVIHYKPKSRYFKKAGHRQPFFKVEIDSIK